MAQNKKENTAKNNSAKTKSNYTKKVQTKTQTKSKTPNTAGKNTVKKANNYRKKTKTKINETPALPLKVISLGGLEEIGKNLTVFEYGEDIILVDCGMSFPDEDMLGIDIVIPDFTYIVKNKDRVRGLFLTHGHEDHIGAIPYLFKQDINIPIYGTRLTLGLVEGKMKEHNLTSVKYVPVTPGERINAGSFNVEFIHVNHSIPEAVAMAIRCPAGLFVHTGDFKIDMTPIDSEPIDLARFSQLGQEGVTALFADSTNAERKGFTPSERTVGKTFSAIFENAKDKRIVVATFSSNIHRMQQIIDEAVKWGRKVAVSGRSMLNAIAVAEELGCLKVPQGVIISIDIINRFNDEDLVIMTTGSQGEPMSALSRMAFSDHRKVSLGSNDLVIISANPIPGNEKLVSKVINELMKLGCQVVYEKSYDIHVSGHACQEELKTIMSLVKPKFFMPLHGEYRHLYHNKEIAVSMGIDEKNVMLSELGNVIEFTKNSMKCTGTVQAGKQLVDGLGVGDVGNIVLKDRKHLAEDGLIAVVMTIDSVSGDVLAGPEIVSRGFVYVRESEQLIDEARSRVYDVLMNCDSNDWNLIRTKVRDELSRFIYIKTRRNPMILPIIMEV
ncbi:MAG: ribonuclease J [Acutalibacteraceae bacterium]|nr:ribonuclease J [Acutalibacteraceae bacterium]